VHVPDRTLLAGALGLAAVALVGGLTGSLAWPLAIIILVLSLGAAVWVRRRSRAAAEEPSGPKIESGLRIVEKPIAAGRPRLPHVLRVTISTEVAVALGLRVVCDVHIPEVEALAQTGRSSSARQGVPPSVRESRHAWLFVVRNSPGQREMFLRVDLFSAQPIHLTRVEQIRPGGAVVLPEWKEFEGRPAAPAPDAGADSPRAPTP
jgi:hypothetical protein